MIIFQSILTNQALFLKAAGAEELIDLSLKPNHHEQI